FAIVRFTGRDGARFDRGLAPIEPQVGLARGAVGAVAGEAVFQQNRPDVAVVFDWLGGEGRRRPAGGDHQDRQGDNRGARPRIVAFRFAKGRFFTERKTTYPAQRRGGSFHRSGFSRLLLITAFLAHGGSRFLPARDPSIWPQSGYVATSIVRP